ncbi:unnamed protein product, partial [Mycena citricolor]
PTVSSRMMGYSSRWDQTLKPPPPHVERREDSALSEYHKLHTSSRSNVLRDEVEPAQVTHHRRSYEQTTDLERSRTYDNHSAGTATFERADDGNSSARSVHRSRHRDDKHSRQRSASPQRSVSYFPQSSGLQK